MSNLSNLPNFTTMKLGVPNDVEFKSFMRFLVEFTSFGRLILNILLHLCCVCFANVSRCFTESTRTIYEKMDAMSEDLKGYIETGQLDGHLPW